MINSINGYCASEISTPNFFNILITLIAIPPIPPVTSPYGDKKKLNGIASIYRYHFRRLCVIQYKIKYIGKCYVPVIIEISTEEKAHKSYKRNVKKR